MRLLLDTHAFLWWVLDDPRLSATARGQMARADVELLWSTASTWELAIKAGLGRFTLDRPLERFLAEQFAAQSVEVLPVSQAHACRVADLPCHHRDPFDRMRVVQAQVEGVGILSADAALRNYDVDVIW